MFETVPIVLLSFLGEFKGDMILVLKIFILLTILSYIKNHLGTGPLAIIAMVGVSWFVIFDYFWFFGGVYVLYMLLAFGVSAILIDFFFVGGGASGGDSAPISSGSDFAGRQAIISRGKQSIANNLLRRGRMGR